MDFLKSVFTHPAFFGFVGGFIVGLIFYAMGLISHWKTRREFKRYQKHLADKLHLDAEQLGWLKRDLESQKKENENLRMKINAGTAKDSAQTLKRELEIFARAEKSMLISAPGFAPAWEMAKEAALREVEIEEQGKSRPRSLFRKFVGGGVDSEKLLTVKDAEEAAPSAAEAGSESEAGEHAESKEETATA
jgi:hypothetical protein